MRPYASPGAKRADDADDESYRIYLIKRPGRLLHFWTLRLGAYSRLGAY